MPSRIMHYCVGNEITKIIMLNKRHFAIGNLSPDAHDGTYYAVGLSHYKTAYKPGIDKYPVVNLISFKNKYLTKDYDDFLLGYYCHLITDNLWSKCVYFEYLECDEEEKNIRVEKCYQDYFTLNKILIKKYNLDKEILHVPKQIHVDEITSTNLQRIVEEFYDDFNTKNDNGVLQILSLHFIQDFIKYVVEECLKEIESLIKKEQLKINYHVRNSCDLYDIADNTFDIVLSSMMLMDCEDFEGTVNEITRVLKPSGKLFASVCHPCFHYSGGIGRQDKGIDKKVVVSNYYHPTEWEAPLSSGSVKVIWRHRTIQDYVKTFIKCGLTITDLNEPVPTEEQAAITVDIAWMQKIPIFLFWELRK